jgi:hypothetical protein
MRQAATDRRRSKESRKRYLTSEFRNFLYFVIVETHETRPKGRSQHLRLPEQVYPGQGPRSGGGPTHIPQVLVVPLGDFLGGLRNRCDRG